MLEVEKNAAEDMDIYDDFNSEAIPTNRMLIAGNHETTSVQTVSGVQIDD